MFGRTTSTRLVSFHYASVASLYKSLEWFFMCIFSIFLFCLTIIQLLEVKWVFPFQRVRRMIIILSGILPMTTTTTTFTLTIVGKITLTSGNGSDSVGRDWWFFISSSLFCSATRKHDINSEYLVNMRSLYCYCSSTLAA